MLGLDLSISRRHTVAPHFKYDASVNRSSGQALQYAHFFMRTSSREAFEGQEVRVFNTEETVEDHGVHGAENDDAPREAPQFFSAP
jgi:hypothetical protein